MSCKMHFIFVVYVCILQCPLFEFRVTYYSHVHQTPDHHHGLRVARSAQPRTVLVTPAPSSNPEVKSSASSETPNTTNTTKTNEPIHKSNPVNESKKTTSENPTNDKTTITKQEESEVKETKPGKTTNTKQEDSEVKEIKPGKTTNTKQEESEVKEIKPGKTTNTKPEESEVKEIKPVKTEDDKVTISTTEMENPSAENIAAPKENNPEIYFTPSAPISDSKPSKTQVEPEITPMPNKKYHEILVIQTAYPANMTQKLPETKQQTKNEAEERPMTPTYVLHKSSNTSVPTKNAEKEEISPANVASNNDSTAQQASPTNGPKNVQTVPEEKVQCTECRAAQSTKKYQGEI